MPGSPRSLHITDTYRDRLNGLSDRLAAVVGAYWQRVTLDDLDRSHAEWLALSTTMLEHAQQQGVHLTAAYLAAFVASERGRRAAEIDLIDPVGYAGVSSDGRPLGEALYPTVITVKTALKDGKDPGVALAEGSDRAMRLAGAAVMSAPRSALMDRIATHPEVEGWRRVTHGGCGACLAAAAHGYDKGHPLRVHDHCVPAGVVASGPSVEKATRRPYEGELILIRTAAGDFLPITPNHPVLTDRGWVPAGLVKEGENVFRCGREQRAPGAVNPDEHDVPTLIEEVWSALRVEGLAHVPTTTEDFHGDGGYGDVDVVATDGLLGLGRLAGLRHPSGEDAFRFGRVRLRSFTRLGDGAYGFIASRRTTRRCVGCGCQLSPLMRTQAVHPSSLSGAAISDRHSGFFEASIDDAARHAQAFREGFYRFPLAVATHEVVRQFEAVGPRFDPRGMYESPEGAEAYARLGCGLADRLPIGVERATVTELRRVGFRGHVFNLQTTEGWYAGNGIIVSNCHCTAEPVVRDVPDSAPRATGPEIFHGMSRAEQDASLGPSAATLVRQGLVAWPDLIAVSPMKVGPDMLTQAPVEALAA